MGQPVLLGLRGGEERGQPVLLGLRGGEGPACAAGIEGRRWASLCCWMCGKAANILADSEAEGLD